jgi:hypothetical protein
MKYLGGLLLALALLLPLAANAGTVSASTVSGTTVNGISVYASSNLDVGGTTASHVKITGRGAAAITFLSACSYVAGGGYYIAWTNNSFTCAQACTATQSSGCTASCSTGWVMFNDQNNYSYGNECSTASYTGVGGILKYCCCTQNCGYSLYAN